MADNCAEAEKEQMIEKDRFWPDHRKAQVEAGRLLAFLLKFLAVSADISDEDCLGQLGPEHYLLRHWRGYLIILPPIQLL